jgi:hypothetical protein
MTVKITAEEPNVFPVVEDVDARDNGSATVIFVGTRTEGEFVTVTINLTYERAGDLAGLLKSFANMNN